MSDTEHDAALTNTAARYTRVPGIVETDLGAELILLDPATQEMFSLNATGRLVWRSLNDESMETIVGRMVDAFDVGHDVANADARALLRQLLVAKLAVATSGAD